MQALSVGPDRSPNHERRDRESGEVPADAMADALSVHVQPNWALPYSTDDLDARRLLKIAAVALWMLNLADIVTTYWALQLGAHEANPLSALLLRSYAIIPFKLLLCSVVTWTAWTPHYGALRARQIAQGWFVVGVYFLAIYSNSMHIWALTH